MSSLCGEEIETYHSYDVCIGEATPYRDLLKQCLGQDYYVPFKVDKDGKLIFCFRCLIPYDMLWNLDKGIIKKHPVVSPIDDQRARPIAQNILRKEGLKWAHGIIDLGRFEEGKLCEDYWIELDKKKADSLSDSEIRDELLKALYRIRSWCPGTYDKEYERMDVDGFCDVLDISRGRYRLNAEYLAGEELIEAPSMDTGYIYITITGVKKVELEINKPRMGFGP